jgi:alcohol dehydrogenase (cytochrome c)
MGGSFRPAPDEPARRVLRAFDIRTGKAAWELPQAGPAVTWGGTLTTATGLVFLGEDGGGFMAVDAADGKPLWHFAANANWKASPMTYVFDGRQYVAIAANGTIVAFALQE